MPNWGEMQEQTWSIITVGFLFFRYQISYRNQSLTFTWLYSGKSSTINHHVWSRLFFIYFFFYRLDFRNSCFYKIRNIMLKMMFITIQYPLSCLWQSETAWLIATALHKSSFCLNLTRARPFFYLCAVKGIVAQSLILITCNGSSCWEHCQHIFDLFQWSSRHQNSRMLLIISVVDWFLHCR